MNNIFSKDSNITQDSYNKLLSEYADMAHESTKINSVLYSQYKVKRGLRNSDGSGVLVGLTTVGSVVGYAIDNQEVKPIDGRLLYRGIEIRDLVNGFQKDKRFGYEETVFLLLFGKLPTADQLDKFCDFMEASRALPDRFKEDAILPMPSPDVMNKLARCILSSYAFDPNPDDISATNVTRQCIELISRLPTFAVYGYQAKAHYYLGQSLHMRIPEPTKSTAEHILCLLRPYSEYSPLEAEILDLCLALHADHGGGNNSTFTTHVVSSTYTDTYSAIAAAILSLKGPRHGGANIQVAHMIADLKNYVTNWNDLGQIRDYISKLLDKQVFDKSGLIYGLGHAVYKLSDPRAEILEAKAKELAEVNSNMDEFYLYKNVAEIGQELFQEKTKLPKLCINVDFFSGLIYKMLNIPEDLFTPLFAVGRIPGWAAHRIEELNGNGRVIRPAYKFILPETEYTPINKRN